MRDYAPKGASQATAVQADRQAEPPGWTNAKTAERLRRLGARPLAIAEFLGRRPRRRSERKGG